ncbi:MAG: VWA domain-containing protein [Terriglobales bacterium]|jgi:VWFA-related protein
MLSHWYSRSALVMLLVLTYASGAEVSVGDPNHPSGPPTYRSTVSEVRVTFFATDESNHAVATLTKSDFAVVDNEIVIRRFRSLAPSDETALDVVALVDLSESVAPRLRSAMSDVLELVAREQSIADDNFAVLSFGGALGLKSAGMRPAVLCQSGCGTSDSVSRLVAVKGGGTTPLFDGLIFGADFVAHHRRAGARPVVILFSDGNDTVSQHSARDALRAALDGGAPIYSVDIGTPQNQASYQTSGSAFLRQVSETTGGRYFCLSQSQRSAQQDSAATVLNAVLEDLRASYVVTYDLPNHGAGFHSLRLMPTHNLNLTFHSRSGYYYEPGVH